MPNSHLRTDILRARTDDGWLLELKRTFSPKHLRHDCDPLLIVPGYGMNGHIFGYHPRGTSMTRHLANEGFEVWTVNLRGQDRSTPLHSHAGEPSIERYALYDLPAALKTVLHATHTHRPQAMLLGCSLGGTISYSYLVHTPAAPVSAIVAMGTPLRWEKVHPAIRLAFSSPTLIGLLRVRGARQMARIAIPALKHLPQLLSIYVNATQVDVSKAAEIVETVEDPHPRINQELSRWIIARDLTIRGLNITRELSRITMPLLLITSNRDGVVPEITSLAARKHWGSRDVDVLRVGNADTWYAHADLYVADTAPREVFTPLAAWLRARNISPALRAA
ncbi:MAG: alpha/beta fold hydrolase [Sandaracinaceae bacterium]|nr:alpha/beta fold hydrolase [Sandaracinaceae bacterium]